MATPCSEVCLHTLHNLSVSQLSGRTSGLTCFCEINLVPSLSFKAAIKAFLGCARLCRDLLLVRLLEMELEQYGH
jgi:hypothetical protein